MIITDQTRYKEPDKWTRKNYEDAFETKAKMAREFGSELPLFALGYWTCINNHNFDRGRVRSPSECPLCQARLVKWVPGPSSSEEILTVEDSAKNLTRQ